MYFIFKNKVLLMMTLVFCLANPLKADSEYQNYPMLGVTLGIGPLMGINLLGGYSIQKIGFHVTGMYRNEDLSCIQGNLFYKIYEDRLWMHSLGVVGGKTVAPADEKYKSLNYNYTGLAYNLSAYSAFFELSLTKGFNEGEEEPLTLFQYVSCQFGLMHRFY